jgi:hypothetical protein
MFTAPARLRAVGGVVSLAIVCAASSLNAAARASESQQSVADSASASSLSSAGATRLLTEASLPNVNEPLVPSFVPDALRSLCASRLFSSEPAAAYTWHLSVINGGQPRPHSTTLEEPQTPGAATPWPSAEAMDQAHWNFRSGIATFGRYRVTFGAADGLPLRGDFNGDGLAEIGVFVNGQWFIDLNGNGRWDERDLWVQLGQSGDLPVTGDWDGDGKADIGVFGRAWPHDTAALENEVGLPDAANSPRGTKAPSAVAGGGRMMRLTARGPLRIDPIDYVFQFGTAGDVPVVGDWNGDTIDNIGIFRDGRWVLDTNGDGRFNKTDASFAYGAEGDLPIAADWNNDGITEVGIYRGGEWRLDNGDRVLNKRDTRLQFGTSGDLPIAGHFADDGRLHVGLFRAKEQLARRE